MFQKICLSIIFLTLQSFSQLVFAKPVIFAIPDFFPFSSSDTSTAHKGIFYEMIEQIMKDSQIDYEIHVLPFSRISKEFPQGLIDISFGFTKPGGKNLFKYGCHYNIFVSHLDSKIVDFESLAGKRVGFVNNGIYQRLYKDKFNTVNSFINSDVSLFNMLVAKRIDGFFISNIVLDGYMQFGVPKSNLPENWQASFAEPLIISSSPVFMHVSEKSEVAYKVIHEIQKSGMEKLKQGAYADIYRRYGIQNSGKCMEEIQK